MKRSLNLIFALSLAAFLAGCKGTPVPNDCSPACTGGMQCDPDTLTCVSATADLSANVGQDLALGPGCHPKCAGLTPYCNAMDKCVGCLTDDNCPLGNVCKQIAAGEAICEPGCSTSQRCNGADAGSKACCMNQCIDTMTDTNNCGACGTVCTGKNSVATCVGGKCVVGTCNPGYGDCNLNPADGCEANLHIDPNNCTACGMVCTSDGGPGILACADGCYVTGCHYPFASCGVDPMACDSNVLSDFQNCGACGNACPNPGHNATCVTAVCTSGACNPGFADCDNNPKNGCEAQLSNDNNNCGKCGMKCGDVNCSPCTKGVCTCNHGYGCNC